MDATGTKQKILKALDNLPPESLTDVEKFLDYLQFKAQRGKCPVQLGGLWHGVTISDEDIAEARREMWSRFGEDEA
jgi:hypothetical protein